MAKKCVNVSYYFDLPLDEIKVRYHQGNIDYKLASRKALLDYARGLNAATDAVQHGYLTQSLSGNKTTDIANEILLQDGFLMTSLEDLDECKYKCNEIARIFDMGLPFSDLNSVETQDGEVGTPGKDGEVGTPGKVGSPTPYPIKYIGLICLGVIIIMGLLVSIYVFVRN